jgi:hypothetical protein
MREQIIKQIIELKGRPQTQKTKLEIQKLQQLLDNEENQN